MNQAMEQIIRSAIEQYSQRSPTFCTINIAKFILEQFPDVESDVRSISRSVAIFCIHTEWISVFSANARRKRYKIDITSASLGDVKVMSPRSDMVIGSRIK